MKHCSKLEKEKKFRGGKAFRNKIHFINIKIKKIMECNETRRVFVNVNGSVDVWCAEMYNQVGMKWEKVGYFFEKEHARRHCIDLIEDGNLPEWNGQYLISRIRVW